MKRSMSVTIVMALSMIACISLVHAEKKDDTKVTVAIKGMKFDPAQLEIAVGDTVVWKNKDDRDYNVVAKDGSFKSDNLSKGDTFHHTFTKAGKFTYGCSYHPRMKATVIVGGAN